MRTRVRFPPPPPSNENGHLVWPFLFDFAAAGIEFASATGKGASRTNGMNCFIPFAYEPGCACKRNRALQGRFPPPPPKSIDAGIRCRQPSHFEIESASVIPSRLEWWVSGNFRMGLFESTFQFAPHPFESTKTSLYTSLSKIRTAGGSRENRNRFI